MGSSDRISFSTFLNYVCQMSFSMHAKGIFKTIILLIEEGRGHKRR